MTTSRDDGAVWYGTANDAIRCRNRVARPRNSSHSVGNNTVVIDLNELIIRAIRTPDAKLANHQATCAFRMRLLDPDTTLRALCARISSTNSCTHHGPTFVLHLRHNRNCLDDRNLRSADGGYFRRNCRSKGRQHYYHWRATGRLPFAFRTFLLGHSGTHQAEHHRDYRYS